MKYLLMMCALLATACGGVKPDMDSNSDGDEVRDRALAVFVDRSTTDRVDANSGDNTDWKYMDVIDQGRLNITVSIDTPDKLKGAEIAVHDEFGTRMERLLIVPNQTNYSFGTEVEKIPNKYFVKVFAKEGTSAYTIGARLAYAPKPPPPAPVVQAPPPEPIEEPPPEPVRKRRVVRKRTPRPKPVVKKAPPPPPPEPAAASVTGRVIRVTPSEDASYVTLTVRVSGAVKKGSSAQVYKGGGMVGSGRVTRGGSRTASVRVNMPPGKFTGSLTVKF